MDYLDVKQIELVDEEPKVVSITLLLFKIYTNF